MASNAPTPELVTTDRLEAAIKSLEVRLVKWQIMSTAAIVGIGVAFLKLTA